MEIKKIDAVKISANNHKKNVFALSFNLVQVGLA